MYNADLCNTVNDVCLSPMRYSVEEEVVQNNGDRDLTANFEPGKDGDTGLSTELLLL